jgi:hypothetical protein
MSIVKLVLAATAQVIDIGAGPQPAPPMSDHEREALDEEIAILVADLSKPISPRPNARPSSKRTGSGGHVRLPTVGIARSTAGLQLGAVLGDRRAACTRPGAVVGADAGGVGASALTV